MQRILPRELTSYDLFKAAAVFLMIVDHVGYYFYPDDLWWRTFGRLCVPVWFFLIGYARSRDLGPRLWGGALLLVVANVASGMHVFPLNILVTIIAVRVVLDPLMARFRGQDRALWAFSIICIAVSLPTARVAEYGTQALVMALAGYLARRAQDGDPAVPHTLAQQYMIFSIVTFAMVQYFLFQMNQAQGIVLGAGLLLVMLALSFFRPAAYAGTGQGAARVLTAPLRFCGRYTLEIYVFHLLLFKGLALLWLPQQFKFMNWSWFSP